MTQSSPVAPVRVEKKGPVTTLVLCRPDVRNAVDRHTAHALTHALRSFDEDPDASVGVLCGEGGHFCAGADLKAIANGTPNDLLPIPAHGPIPDAPMGPTRMQLRKPLIAAVSGHAVAGGLELALFCDLRVADADAVFGVFCRRVGVPLIDGGTVRLPQIIGLGRALDLILTGRPVRADEALAMGLINRICPPGLARSTAEHLAAHLATLPQHCLRSDRQATLAQADDPLPLRAALARELAFGLDVLSGGDSLAGASSFSRGQFRHGNRD